MERAVPILPADDLIAAKTFYVDGLGFQVTFEVPHLLGLQRGTIELTLDTQMEGHGRNACVGTHPEVSPSFAELSMGCTYMPVTEAEAPTAESETRDVLRVFAPPSHAQTSNRSWRKPRCMSLWFRLLLPSTQPSLTWSFDPVGMGLPPVKLDEAQTLVSAPSSTLK